MSSQGSVNSYQIPQELTYTHLYTHTAEKILCKITGYMSWESFQAVDKYMYCC